MNIPITATLDDDIVRVHFDSDSVYSHSYTVDLPHDSMLVDLDEDGRVMGIRMLNGGGSLPLSVLERLENQD